MMFRTNQNNFKHNLALVLFGFLWLYRALPSGADSATDQSSSDWTIQCRTFQLLNYNDPNLSITPIIEEKIVAGAFPANPNSSISYEDLWYGKREAGLCLGARRYCELVPPENCHHVVIQVLANTGAVESSAAADAVVRVVVDCLLKDVWTKSVVVPDDTFDQFVKALSFYAMKVPDKPPPVGSKAWGFMLISTSGARSVVIQHE